MKAVYMLTHSRKVEEEANETKLIGFYSTREKALNVVERYKSIIGFRDYPDDFLIEKWEADIDDYNDVIGEFDNVVYYLSHEYFDGVEYDYVTSLGVYSTFMKAKDAREKYQKQKRFEIYPLGFSLDEYKLDEDNWTEGFDNY